MPKQQMFGYRVVIHVGVGSSAAAHLGPFETREGADSALRAYVAANPTNGAYLGAVITAGRK